MTQTSATDPKWERVLALELESVRLRLCAKKGIWWHLRHGTNTLRLAKEYRQFLYLIMKHPSQTVIPWSQALDDFWHEHILDTAKYAKDCEDLFGGFIHHNPNVPKNSPAHFDNYKLTAKMYREAFKEKIAGKSRDNIGVPGCGSNMPVAFCRTEFSQSAGHHYGSGHGHAQGGHGGGGHGGHGGHGCGGHGCGGHGGH
jgi:hypothetical protein